MPAKKNKKTRNKSKCFKIGDPVKIKKGVMCPDDDTVCMSGWQGRVFDVDDDVVGIRWDSITLRQLPVDYITKSEEEGLGWTEMYLKPDEIELATPRDSEKEAGNTAEEFDGAGSMFTQLLPVQDYCVWFVNRWSNSNHKEKVDA